MPYCANCGSAVTDKMLFCPRCGRELRTPEAGFKDDKIRDYTAEAEEKEPEDVLDQRIRKGKLYKQWVEYAGLPVDEIQSTEASRDILVSEERPKLNLALPKLNLVLPKRNLALMCILLGICIGILCMALVFLLIQLF